MLIQWSIIMEVEELQQLPPETLLRLGSAGRAVVLLKRALAGHGYGPAQWQDPVRALSGNYDAALRTVVTVFQRQHGLEPDGIAGPKTLKRLAQPPEARADLLAPLRAAAHNATGDGVERMLAVARAALALHIRETGGNNRGPLVEALQVHAGCREGDPWCAAFCDVCAGVGFGAAQQQLPLRIGVSCSDLIRRAAKQGRVFELAQSGTGEFPAGSPEPGDLLVLRAGKTSTRAKPYRHIGIVVSALNERGVLETIEGNTNDAGLADGDGVYQKRRDPRRALCVFVNLR
jgi:hypothetical protein